MKYILAIVLLSFAVPVMAGEGVIRTEKQSICTLESDDGLTHEWTNNLLCRSVEDVGRDRACLIQMRQAMNAMEPFIMASWHYEMPDGPERKAKVKQLQRAEEVWGIARRDCFTHP